METESLHLQMVLILTVGFSFASILGYCCYRAKVSPILGYLIAGFLIGPYSPGFVADRQVAEQMAEIGVILMMFGVGLHFKWQDLLGVRNTAIPGAVGQTLASTIVGALLIKSLGWSWEAGIIFGLAIGVASTVVMVRVLADNKLLDKPEGHLAIGWLIVEDIITVTVLLLVPTLAASTIDDPLSFGKVSATFAIVLGKFALLTLFMFTLGKRIVAYIVFKIVDTKSHELFIITTLALTFVIAAGSAFIFGTSIALGAFIAGMVLGQTNERRQVSAGSLPLQAAFVVIFFLSVGMLFNPFVLADNIPLFLGTLAIILAVKPLVALGIALVFKHSFKTSLLIAIALAQIGEFSFILAEEAMKFHILPEEGYDIIVVCALISISLNPFLFKLAKRRKPKRKSA